MGVDHGLQGRNNKKGQEKRFRKAKRIKAIAMAALTGGKKKEIVFNEASRVEFLTGFRKRKSERRQFGLAMQVLKEKKQLADSRKARRGHVDSDDSDNEDNQNLNDQDTIKILPQDSSVIQTSFTDNQTNQMFGGSVSVTVNSGIENPEAFESNTELNPRKNKKELNKFEKAMKAAKVRMQQNTINSKKKKLMAKIQEQKPNDRKNQWKTKRKKA
jgi:hypothetical protein